MLEGDVVNHLCMRKMQQPFIRTTLLGITVRLSMYLMSGRN